MVGLAQSNTVALDGFCHLVDGCILRHNGFLQFISHTLQSDALALGHTLHRHPRHHRHYVGHFSLCDGLALAGVATRPLLLQQSQFALQCRLAVAIAGCQLEVLVLHSSLLLLLDEADFLLLLDNRRRHLGMLQMDARTHFIEGIDGLVGEETVGHVAFCQFDTCRQSVIRV